jgi:DtxR family Mn-dependent transcriptional regulator
MEKKKSHQLAPLSSSAEDYLEAIYLESLVRSPVRGKDIAERLGVAAPSVTQAVKTLVSAGLALSERYGAIQLTAAGQEIGQKISSSHHILRVFFEEVLGIDHETADRNACIAEHGLAPEITARLSCLVKWMTAESGGKPPLPEFHRHLSTRLGKAEQNPKKSTPSKTK